MSATLKLMLAEREAQRLQEARPPFTTVASLRNYIDQYQPSKYDNISVEMCILSLVEHDTMWKMELIDKELEAEFDEIAPTANALDSARRNKFVFQLTLWKEKKPTFYSDVKCCAGWAYRIDKIHSLTARFGCPTGSLQLSKAAMIVRIKQDDEPTNMGTDQSTSRPDTGSELAVANAPESTAKAASMVVTSAMQSSQEKTDRHSGSSNAIYATSGAETASPTEQGTLPAPIGVVPLLERSSPRSGCQDSKITANPDHSNQNKATSTAARALEFSTPKRKSHVLTERIQSASPGKRVRLHKA